jgi:hypothetical protein
MATSIETSRRQDPELDRVQSLTSAEEGFYIINFPAQDKQYVFDLRHPFEDEDGAIVFPITTWVLGGSIAGLASTMDGLMYLGSAGVVGLYNGLNDDGSTFEWDFWSGWLDFGQANHQIKMLKELIASVKINAGTITYQWEFDFSGTELTRSVSYTGQTAAEYNIAEYTDGGGPGIGYIDPPTNSQESEYSGTARVQRKLIAAHGEGQFLRLGATATAGSFEVSLQHMSVAPKLGRLVT